MLLPVQSPFALQASPLRKPLVVLYLDFDGVLHHEAVYSSRKLGAYIDAPKYPAAKLFEHQHYLVDALAPFPGLKLVLSTTWVRLHGFDRTKKRLCPELQARVIGATFHRVHHGGEPGLKQLFMQTPRGVQIVQDVSRRKPAAWLALDDDTDGWPAAHRHHLVACDGEFGISKLTTRTELQQKLQLAYSSVK